MQALTHQLGGQVDASAQREYGHASIEPVAGSLADGLSQVWMSHGDRITRMPEGFEHVGALGAQPTGGHRGHRAALLRCAVPSRGASHAAGRAPAASFCGGDLRGESRLDRRLDHPTSRGARARAGRKRTGARSGERRRGFHGGGRPGAPGDRRSTRDALRGQRLAAAGGAGTGGGRFARHGCTWN